MIAATIANPRSNFIVAVAQLNSGIGEHENAATVVELMRQASAAGADIVSFPECCNALDRQQQNTYTLQAENLFLQQVCSQARDLAIWVHLGSLVLQCPHSNKLLNRSMVITATGEIQDVYDKIHLFDVVLGGDEQYRESDAYLRGNQTVVSQLPWCAAGLAICYDVRFPYLFRKLVADGAQVICIPAAFTYTTGKAHWEILLRARAIENSVYVIAAAQVGRHQDGRHTWGHSMVINPWGEVECDAAKTVNSIQLATIDLEKIASCRRAIPAWSVDNSDIGNM